MSILWFASWWYELSNFFVVSISTSRTPRFTIKVVEFYNGLLMPLHGIYKYPCFVLVLLLESIYVLNNEQMVEIPWNLKWNCVLSHWECSLSYLPFILLSIFKSNHFFLIGNRDLYSRKPPYAGKNIRQAEKPPQV